MFDILKTLVTVALGIGVFVGVLLGLYWLVSRLPEPWRERGRIWVFVGPAILALVIGLVYPSLRTGYRALFGDGSKGEDFVGLKNFGELFTNTDNLLVLRNNLWWVILVTAFSTAIGIAIARFADGMRGEPIAKALIFLPTAISLVGAGIIWRFIYATNGNRPEKQFGLLNYLWLKLDPILPGKQEVHFWLQDKEFFGISSNFLPGTNTIFMIIVVIWIQAGFATVVLSAAMKGVPDDLVEAARIDGATERQAFFKIVIPYVKTTIVTVATTTVIATLKIFDIIQSMGSGGIFENNTIANDMYSKSFIQDREGYGAMLAVILFFAVIPIVWINARNQRSLRESR